MSVPKAYPFNVAKIIKLQRKLHDEVLLEHHGFIHTGLNFEDLVKHVHEAMPKADYTALWQSLQSLAGTPIRGDMLKELSWRLAGNLHNLQQGITVPPWSFQMFAEWAPLQIVQVVRCEEKTYSRGGKQYSKPAVEATIFFLGGLAAGRTIHKKWSESLCYRMRTVLGFSKYNRAKYSHDPTKVPNYPLLDMLELTRMRFNGLVTPACCGQGLDFEDMACPSSCRTWNKKLMKIRLRQGYQCPFAYPLGAHPCFRCHVGYSKCRAACHPATYTTKPCPQCKNPEAFFDPANPAAICVNCLNPHIRTKKPVVTN